MKATLNSRKLALGVGIGLPFLFVLGLYLFIYLPASQLRLDQDFLYTTDGYGAQYEVKQGRLAPVEDSDTSFYNRATLYLFDASTESSHYVSPEDAMQYRLSPTGPSVEGYIVEPASSDGHMPFWVSSEYTVVLQKDGLSRRLPVNKSYGFDFIGWVDAR